MNTPNKLTILRTILIPVFIAIYLVDSIPFNNYIAASIFVVASLTDFFDGYLARKYNLITNFGKFLDPLADKMLVNSALICFLVVENNPMPVWVVLVIIMRDFIINGIRLVASDNNTVIAADFWGKIKTTIQMIMVVVLLVNLNNLFFDIIELILIYSSVGLTILSLIDCMIKNINVLKDMPIVNDGGIKENDLEGLTRTTVKLLRDNNMTITFAESCTGGLCASSLIDIPGSSDVLKQSVVTYCNDAKINILGVYDKTIEDYTEVSEECALEMADGARKWSGADIGVAITGIAGPDGGTKDKPLGTVYIAYTTNDLRKGFRFNLTGDRNQVRKKAVSEAFKIVNGLFVR